MHSGRGELAKTAAVRVASSGDGLITPWEMAERVEATCLALPEVSIRADDWARLCNIRGKTFCFLSAFYEPDGDLTPVLVIRANPDEQAALLASGHPYFTNRGGYDRVEVILDDDTDWEEISELIIASYRRLAPKKLAALLDGQ